MCENETMLQHVCNTLTGGGVGLQPVGAPLLLSLSLHGSKFVNPCAAHDVTSTL